MRVAQDTSGGSAEPVDELGREFGPGDATDAIGAELHRALSAW